MEYRKQICQVDKMQECFSLCAEIQNRKPEDIPSYVKHAAMFIYLLENNLITAEEVNKRLQ